MRISFIGGGVMGEAIMKCILDKDLVAPKEIIVSDINPVRLELLNKRYGVSVTDDINRAVAEGDVVFLAIKPAELGRVMGTIKTIAPRQLVISIVGGATLDSISNGLNHNKIVRAMPNMPVQIGKGMTAWIATSDVSTGQKEIARSILSAIGEEIYFDQEKYLDMATALSGSGPAYIFLVIEALTDAGVHIGFSRDIAEKMVIETVMGAAKAVKEMSKHPAELKNMVTSPGGTTTEALLQLENGGIRSLFLQAVIAAYKKAKDLGK